MSNDQALIKALFQKYANGSASPAEVKELFKLVSDKQYDEDMKNLLLGELQETELEDNYDTERWSNVFDKVKAETELMEYEEKPVRYRVIRKLAVAASIAACLGIGFYFYQHQSKQIQSEVAKNDIAPGGNKAVLTLANGKKISLTDAKNGTIAQQAGVQVTKTKNGQLIYIVSAASGTANSSTQEVAYNTIETPKGGQYEVVLPDGSKVWLNAASSITYPLAFNGNDRVVKITGEVYFEVVHNAAHPFKVSSANQTIEDIGTHFNVNAYADETATKTTLLEGAVKVTGVNGETGVKLEPGQQAVSQTSNNLIKVKDADVDAAVAWKNGFSHFDHADIQAVMRTLARWYDVEVIYEGDIPKREFSGDIPRNLNASKALDVLALLHIDFKIDGKKIIVTKQKK